MGKQGEHLVKHQFKKGQSGNPEGGRAHSPELRAIKNLTEKEMVEIGSLLLKGSLDELRALSKDPKASVLKAMIASVAAKTISSGNAAALDTLLNRLIGKVKENVYIHSDNNTAITVVPPDVAKKALTEIESDV